MRYYPIFLDLRGRRCAVVGGGRVAERKVRALLRAGANVHVISPSVTPRLALLAACKKIELTPRAYRTGDLKISGAARPEVPREVRPALVFAATDSPETQRAVRKDAAASGALVNTADDARESDFIVPASFAQGDLLVAIATSGASPALARRLRRQLQVTLGREYHSYLRFLREARKQVMDTVPDEAQRTKIFRKLSSASMMDWMKRMPRNYKELQAKMDPASLRDNKQQVCEELKRMASKELCDAKQLTQEKRTQPMKFDSIDDLRRSGFKGFVAISALQKTDCREVPDMPGVYLALRRNTKSPDFLDQSTGGRFKERDPTVEVSRLKNKWVKDALVLYVGKAGPGKKATLRSRLKKYMQFGQEEPVDHWGGRYIWQLRDSGDLLVCWRPTPNAVPRDVEKGLIGEFEAAYSKLPFANIIR